MNPNFPKWLDSSLGGFGQAGPHKTGENAARCAQVPRQASSAAQRSTKPYRLNTHQNLTKGACPFPSAAG